MTDVKKAGEPGVRDVLSTGMASNDPILNILARRRKLPPLPANITSEDSALRLPYHFASADRAASAFRRSSGNGPLTRNVFV